MGAAFAMNKGQARLAIRELVEIVFGMPCNQTVIHTAASAQEVRARPIKLLSRCTRLPERLS